MGKQKRARQKYHLACVTGRLKDDEAKSESGKSILSKKSSGPWKVIPEEDLFKDIEIDVDKLKKPANDEDDRKSVKSISKTIKRSIAESGTTVRLKKKEKRELRRNLFIKKIDAIHELLEKKSKSKKGSKTEDADINLEELPQENMLFFKSGFKQPKGPRPVSLKKKPIAKAKKRTMDLLNNLEAFKKVISDPKYLTDSLGAVTETVQQKVFNEVI
uniref:Unkown protein n=1 Tax=Riptortus pedestris TaxID=329032 RepID=R4WQ10_RIPPE|nr:unkown protein [Riptortus pedestris]